MPFSIAAVPFAFSFREDSPSLLALTMVGFAISVPTALIYFLLLIVIKRAIKGNSTTANISILVSVGILRGLFFFYFIEAMGWQNPSPLLGRLINSTYTVVFWVGLLSILVESNRRFKRRFRAILTQVLLLHLRNSDSPNPGYALIAQQIARMQLNIKKTFQERALTTAELTNAKELAASLRNEIETFLKPLSRRLWMKSIFAPPNAKVFKVLTTSIAQLHYPFTLSALLYGGANLINTTQSLGFQAGIIYGSASILIFWIMEKVRRLAISVWSSKLTQINYIFVIGIGLVVGVSTNLIFMLMELQYSFTVAIFTAPSLPILVVSIAFIKLSFRDRQSLIEILKREVTKHERQHLDSVSHGNVAAYLHNSLQSELFALALQLDELVDNPDPERTRIVMEKLESLISQSRSEDFRRFSETPELRLERIVESWIGIAEVRTVIETIIWNDPERSSILVSLVEEAIANAVRGGRANLIFVEAQKRDEVISVTITDNGILGLVLNHGGLGSEWIDQISVSDWSLESTDNGRILKVEI